METGGKDSNEEIVQLTHKLKCCFLSPREENHQTLKWSVLDSYRKKLLECSFSPTITSSYYSVLSLLLDSLKPTLLNDASKEKLFDEMFLCGIHHEAFMILVRKLNEIGESYQQDKVIDLLQKFIKCSSIESMFKYQCASNSEWDLKYVSVSRIWDDLITLIVSLPERIANKTKGKMKKIFCTEFYVPLLVSAILKALTYVHDRLNDCQGCSLEFLSKLTGKLCVLGHADIIAKKISTELIKVSESDFVWRRISQKFIIKMPLISLESYVTSLLLVIPWYGYVEWIIGNEGIDNEKLKYIMASKALFLKHFKQPIILHNILGYYASSRKRGAQFEKIVDALLKSWSDPSALKYQSFEQQTYLASALMICGAWLEKEPIFCNKAYLHYVINGTQIRIGNSEETIRSLGMIVGESLSSVLDSDTVKLQFEHSNPALVSSLMELKHVPSKPDTNCSIYEDDLICFEKMEEERKNLEESLSEPIKSKAIPNIVEIDSDDDLEPYDLSNDLPQEETKRPLYLRDCMAGLFEQENADWAEQCLKCAESLIKANGDVVHEVAVEMAKILLHLDDKFAIPDFIGLRHRALIALITHCPVLVADYLTSQFYERDYNIRQRLDILEVLAAGSQQLSFLKVKVAASEPQYVKDKFEIDIEEHWRSIIDKRVEAKTRYITKKKKAPVPEAQENKFSSVAGHFFFPLMEKYDKENQMLKLFGEDTYVLGRLTYTLGIIMHSAANLPLAQQMGLSLLQFLLSLKCSDIFVRQACIFAMATIYTSVPGYLLCSEMLFQVMESVKWLKNIVDNDIDVNCQMKASHALGMILAIVTEEMPLTSLLPNM
ncbi:telomere length regulation protein TEL2 homolog [Uloborus diversus]|uniref:telomere length regulation protein TEL2 homolog n=1 Tax=Uloborus diversus TaxID=327109 RepID=UPI002409760D|nr:telomere length regulation protein TEL2 homolog [Uloborus diversus]